MDLLWPTGPRPTDDDDTDRHYTASILTRACSSAPRRRYHGPVVACIDVTSDRDIIIDLVNDHATKDPSVCVGEERLSSILVANNNNNSSGSTTTAPDAHEMSLDRRVCLNQQALIDAVTGVPVDATFCGRLPCDDDGVYDTATSQHAFGPRLCTLHGTMDDHDAETPLLRRQRTKRVRSTNALTHSANRHRQQHYHRQERIMSVPPGRGEPVPSAPSAALFEWDAFRRSLADLASAATTPVPNPVRPMPFLPCPSISGLVATLPMERVDTVGAIVETATTFGGTPSPPPAPSRLIDIANDLNRPNHSAITRNRPYAGIGDVVLIDCGGSHGHRTVATVCDFDGTGYRVIVPRHDGASATAATLLLPLTGSCGNNGVRGNNDTHDGAQWSNAQLDECAVCMDAEANAWLDCRCTVPAMCMACARAVHVCPYCDALPAQTPIGIERDLAIVPADATWIDVPLRIVLDRVDTGRRSWQVRAQTSWPGILLKAIIGHTIKADMNESRILVGGRPLADQVALGAQGISHGRLVCVIPRLRGD